MRLQPCPGCARHVRVVDSDCRFCGASLTTSAPGWLSIALLGLSLAACDPGKPPPSKADDGKSKVDVQPEVEAKPPEPPAPEPEPVKTSTTDVAVEAPTTAADVAPTTAAEPDAGATVADEPPEANDPPPKPKYGAPRPPDEPRPAKKYGAPPKPPPSEP